MQKQLDLFVDKRASPFAAAFARVQAARTPTPVPQQRMTAQEIKADQKRRDMDKALRLH